MKILITAVTALLILTGCKPITQDYVSQYDFNSAYLVDLPWDMGATIVGTGVSFDYDDYVREHHSDWNYIEHALGEPFFMDKSYMPEGSTNHVYTVDDPTSIIPEYSAVDHESCRLTDGMLWHELHTSNGVVQANTRWKGSSPQLKLTRLESGDFNHDGYMDVKVRRDLPGSACPTEVLIISRKTTDGQFYVVDATTGSVRIRTGESWSWEKNDDGTETGQTHTHTHEGMTIAGLAKDYGVSEAVIRSANGLSDDDELQVDTRIIIPEGWYGKGQEAHSDNPPVREHASVGISEDCITHTVYPGETMADVARMYGVTVEMILKQNGLRIDEQIVEGTQLVVPVTD